MSQTDGLPEGRTTEAIMMTISLGVMNLILATRPSYGRKRVYETRFGCHHVGVSIHGDIPMMDGL